MPGMKRVIASNNKQAGISINEGKKSISFDVYKTLYDVLHQGEGGDFLFAHSFLTMKWNLMARSKIFVNMDIKKHSVEFGLLNFIFWNIESQIKPERDPVILGMSKQTQRIQPLVLLLPWLSTCSLIQISWPPIIRYFETTVSMEYF